MIGDKDLPPSQSSESNKGKKNKRNRKKKPVAATQGDDSQPSTSSATQPKVTGIDTVTEKLETLSVRPKAPASVSQKKSTKKTKESGSAAAASNVEEAFNKEDAEDAEEAAKPNRTAKASADSAFADLEKYTGIKLTSTNQSALCLRPRFASGTVGQKTRVLTNFFRLKFRDNMVHQYDVMFLTADETAVFKKEQEVGRKFKRLTKRMNQSILAKFISTDDGAKIFVGKCYAYDNDRILITNKPLDKIEPAGKIFSFQYSENDEGPPQPPKTIYIRFKPTVNLSIAASDKITSGTNFGLNRAVLQVIDIIAKSYAFQHDIIYGSKIFRSPQLSPRIPMVIKKNDIRTPTPYELAFGYHQSTQLCQAGPMQNIDRATAVLYKGGPLIDTIHDLFGGRIPEPFAAWAKEALKELTFLRIETNYRGFPSRHTLRSFTNESCHETFFKDEDGSRKSVAQYFHEHYHIELHYAYLPCVVYNPGRYIPIELCRLLPNQRNQRKLRDELIRIVSQHTTTQKPHARGQSSGSSALGISNQLNSNNFAIELNPENVIVDSRILSSPKLKYGNKPSYDPEIPGSWDMNGKTFLKPIKLTRWACFTLETRRIEKPVADTFIRELMKRGNELGIEIAPPIVPFRKLFYYKDLEEKFKELSKSKLQLIVVIMPEDTRYYSLVKTAGDQKLGVPTQVVLDKHYNPNLQPLSKNKQKLVEPSYLSNLLLKINMKIGGTNLKLSDYSVKSSILNDKTMVVGIDVNHPAPGEKASSIAAVVGSIDKDFAQYHTEIRLNKSRDEIVQVDQMIGPILEAFKNNRGYYPGHIIVYRDGVSEGQFAAVMGTEILPLHKKLEQLPTKPKLTYIIVQKRHNARFFPTNQRFATKSGNILPGSVIDTDVCHYKWFDFYLCSQNSFLGTARPGKYTVLWHSSPATADDLQTATYYLCYLFARATKSIADPAPARYAHHAAARGKVHLNEINRQQRGGNINQQLNIALNVTQHLQRILYFI